jgi:hypothetical protein
MTSGIGSGEPSNSACWAFRIGSRVIRLTLRYTVGTEGHVTLVRITVHAFDAVVPYRRRHLVAMPRGDTLLERRGNGLPRPRCRP